MWGARLDSDFKRAKLGAKIASLQIYASACWVCLFGGVENHIYMSTIIGKPECG